MLVQQIYAELLFNEVALTLHSVYIALEKFEYIRISHQIKANVMSFDRIIW